MIRIIKDAFYRMLRLQFWSILFLETTLVGIVITYTDYIYEDSLIPPMLLSLSFPYFGLLMLVVGAYSFIRLFSRIDLITILLNSAIWVYIAISCVLDMIQTERIHGKSFTAMVAVLSIMICIRILTNAYSLDLSKEEKINKERHNG